MTDKFYSTKTEASAQRIRDDIWSVMQPAMIGLQLWTATATPGEALGWVNKPDGSPGDPETDPISAWVGPVLDTVTGRWLVKSPRNYLAAEAAPNGGLEASYKPDTTRLVDAEIIVGYANSSQWFDSLGADLNFLQRDSGVRISEMADHLDRKAITRNREDIAKADKDEPFTTGERDLAA